MESTELRAEEFGTPGMRHKPSEICSSLVSLAGTRRIPLCVANKVILIPVFIVPIQTHSFGKLLNGSFDGRLRVVSGSVRRPEPMDGDWVTD